MTFLIRVRHGAAPVPIDNLGSRLVCRHPHVVELQPHMDPRRDLGVLGTLGVLVSPRQLLRTVRPNASPKYHASVIVVLDQAEKIGAGRS